MRKIANFFFAEDFYRIPCLLLGWQLGWEQNKQYCRLNVQSARCLYSDQYLAPAWHKYKVEVMEITILFGTNTDMLLIYVWPEKPYAKVEIWISRSTWYLHMESKCLSKLLLWKEAKIKHWFDILNIVKTKNLVFILFTKLLFISLIDLYS